MKFHAKTGLPLIDPGTGQPYVEHEYSDALMALLLNRFFPEQYRERQEVEHSGAMSLTLEEVEQRMKDANA